MKEVWRPLPVEGYERPFRVSNTGRVMKVATQRVLKTSPNARYPRVTVTRFPGDKPRGFDIHRLVAAAFLGDHPGMVVHHKDRNTHNNHLENLEWCTQAQNLAYAREEGVLHDHRLNGSFAKVHER